MSQNLVINGVTYAYPQDGEQPGWGAAAATWAAAVTSGMLQKAGGSFTLTAEVDFGATYGLKSVYFKSRTSNAASAGAVMLAAADAVSFRNAANNGNLDLTPDGSDDLTWGGSVLATQTWVNSVAATQDTFLEMTDTPSAYSSQANKVAAVNSGESALEFISIANANVAAAAAIAVNKLAALTASRAVVSDGSGFLAASAVTATELGQLSGVGSTVVGEDDTNTLTNKTLTSPVLNTGVSGTAVLDEDNLASDSDTQLATQQSIKAYVDTEISALSSSGSNYSAKAADYTVTDIDNIRVVGVTTSTTDRTITLPTAADNTNRIISIKKEDSASGNVIVDGEGAETIDGATTVTISGQYGGITLICNGTSWEQLPGLATATQSGLVKKNKFQQKRLTASESSAAASLTDINFSNLVVGKMYRVYAMIFLEANGTSSTESCTATVTHDSTPLAVARHRNDGQNESSSVTSYSVETAPFVATASTVVFSYAVSGSCQIVSATGLQGTWSVLEEINNYEVTTEF